MRAYQILLVGLSLSSAAFSQEIQRPVYNIGDTWNFERTDRTRNVIDLRTQVTTASKSDSEVRFDAKNLESERVTQFAQDLNGNNIEFDGRKWNAPRPDFTWPLAVGKKWSGKYGGLNQTRNGQFHEERECEAVAAETISVKAGSFQTIKIVCSGNFRSPAASGTVTLSGTTNSTYWYAPEVKRAVKIEYRDQSQFGIWNNSSTEMISFELKK